MDWTAVDRSYVPPVVIALVAGALLTLLGMHLLGAVRIDTSAWAAGATAFVGLLVGHALTRATEAERWRRDQRLAALAAFVETTYSTTLVRGLPGDERLKITVNMIAAMSRVELLAPPALARLSSALNLAARRYARSQEEDQPEDEQKVAKGQFFDLWHDFIREARREIGIKGSAT